MEANDGAGARFGSIESVIDVEGGTNGRHFDFFCFAGVFRIFCIC